LLLPMLLVAQRDTVNLNEFEVIGIRPDISASSPNPVQQITLKKLDAIPTATVGDAIRNFSGITLKDYGGVGGLKTVMIRSLGSNHTAVFVDGLPNNDAATGQSDLGRISLQDVDRIQLSFGQPEFGLLPARMYASAGVLEINSGYSLSDGRKYQLDLSARAGSFGTFNPSLGLFGRIGENNITGFRVNHFTATGDFPYSTGNGQSSSSQLRKNSDVNSTDGMLHTRQVFSDSSILTVKASYNYSDRGLPGAVIYYNDYSVQRLRNNDLLLGISYKTNPARRLKMLITGSLADNRLLYTDPAFQNQTGGIRNEYNQRELYLSDAILFNLLPGLKLSLATDLVHNSLTTNAYSVDNPSRVTSLSAVSMQYKPGKAEIQGSLLLTYAGDRISGTANKNYSRLSPALSIMRQLNPGNTLKVRLSAKNTYRLPTFNELFYTLAGNRALEPETASLYDLGLLFNKASGTLGYNFRAEAFLNKVKNKIVTLPTRNLFIWSSQNIGRVDIAGFEVSGGITGHINKDWSFDLSGNYTYQEAKDVTDKNDDNYRHQIAYIPFETAGGLATVWYRKINLGINTLYSGYRYISGTNITANLLHGWITTDMTLAWQTTFRKQTIKIKAEAVNLFNEQYEIVKSFPMTGRAFYINLSFTI